MDTPSSSRNSEPAPKRRLPPRRGRGVGMGSEIDLTILEAQKWRGEKPLLDPKHAIHLTTDSSCAETSLDLDRVIRTFKHEQYYSRPEVIISYREQQTIATPEFVSLKDAPGVSRFRPREADKNIVLTAETDQVYQRRHKRLEASEKRVRLSELETLKVEHRKLKERIEKLKVLDSFEFNSLPAEAFPPVDDLDLSNPIGPAAEAEGERRRGLMLEAANSLDERYRFLLPAESKPNKKAMKAPRVEVPVEEDAIESDGDSVERFFSEEAAETPMSKATGKQGRRNVAYSNASTSSASVPPSSHSKTNAVAPASAPRKGGRPPKGSANVSAAQLKGKKAARTPIQMPTPPPPPTSATPTPTRAMSVVASEPNESPMEVSDVTVRTPQPPAPVPLPAQASVRVIAPAPVSPAVPASLHVPSEPEAPPVLRDRTDTEDTRPTKRLKTSTSQEQPAVPPPRPFFGPPPPPGFTSTPNPRSAPPPSAAVLPTFRRRDPSLPPIVSISSESLIEPSPATPVAMRQLSAGAGPMEGISSPVTSGTEPAYHTPRGVAPPPRLFHGPPLFRGPAQEESALPGLAPMEGISSTEEQETASPPRAPRQVSQSPRPPQPSTTSPHRQRATTLSPHVPKQTVQSTSVPSPTVVTLPPPPWEQDKRSPNISSREIRPLPRSPAHAHGPPRVLRGSAESLQGPRHVAMSPHTPIQVAPSPQAARDITRSPQLATSIMGSLQPPRAASTSPCLQRGPATPSRKSREATLSPQVPNETYSAPHTPLQSISSPQTSKEPTASPQIMPAWLHKSSLDLLKDIASSPTPSSHIQDKEKTPPSTHTTEEVTSPRPVLEVVPSPPSPAVEGGASPLPAASTEAKASSPPASAMESETASRVAAAIEPKVSPTPEAAVEAASPPPETAMEAEASPAPEAAMEAEASPPPEATKEAEVPPPEEVVMDVDASPPPEVTMEADTSPPPEPAIESKPSPTPAATMEVEGTPPLEAAMETEATPSQVVMGNEASPPPEAAMESETSSPSAVVEVTEGSPRVAGETTSSPHMHMEDIIPSSQTPERLTSPGLAPKKAGSPAPDELQIGSPSPAESEALPHAATEGEAVPEGIETISTVSEPTESISNALDPGESASTAGTSTEPLVVKTPEPVETDLASPAAMDSMSTPAVSSISKAASTRGGHKKRGGGRGGGPRGPRGPRPKPKSALERRAHHVEATRGGRSQRKGINPFGVPCPDFAEYYHHKYEIADPQHLIDACEGKPTMYGQDPDGSDDEDENDRTLPIPLLLPRAPRPLDEQEPPTKRGKKTKEPPKRKTRASTRASAQDSDQDSD